MTDHDPVNHPKHYTSHPSGVECIQVTRHMSFNLGNVIKYLWRADEKNAPLEDLKKARWYLDDEIKRREGTRIVEVAVPAPALEPQWIAWKGGACPVSPDVRVEVRRHDGDCATDLAGYFCWYHAAVPYGRDIVAYRVVG